MKLIDLECQKGIYALFKMGMIDKEAFYLMLSQDKATVRLADSSAEVLGIAERDDESLYYILIFNQRQRDKELLIELHYYDESKRPKHFALKESLPTNVLCHHLNRYNKRLYWVGRDPLEENAASTYVQLELGTGQATVLGQVADFGTKLTHIAVTHNALGGLTYFAGRNAKGGFEVSCLNETTRKLSYLKELSDLSPAYTPTSIKGLHAIGETVCITYDVVSTTNRGVKRVNRCVVFHKGEFKEAFVYPRTSIYYAYYHHGDNALWIFSPHGVLYLPKDPRGIQMVKSGDNKDFSIYLPRIEGGVMTQVYRYPFIDKEFQDPVALTPEELFS